MKVPFLWAQLTIGRLPHSGPRSRTLHEEYLMASIGEGGIDHLSPRRHSTGASLAPTSTTTWKQAPSTTRFSMWMAVLQPETNYLSEWCHHEG
jgi:hypothetical protein